MIPIWDININNGKINFKDERIHEWLSTKKGDHQLLIRKPEEAKSRKLESYYWAVIVALAGDEMGLSYIDTHELLLLQCGKPDKQGETIRTSDIRFSSKKQTGYVERCRMHLAECGVVTPDPNEVEID